LTSSESSQNIRPLTNTVRPIFWGLSGLLPALLVFLPVLNFPFINWDDPAVIEKNLHIRGLCPASILWAFTHFQQGFYIPLNWISLAIDYRIGGLDPWVYHLHNLLLHAFNILLVFLLSHRVLTLAVKNGSSSNQSEAIEALPIALLSAIIFGIHPLHVETVAWATERKDLLCALFYFASLLAYLDYASRPDRSYWRLGSSLVFFLLASLSKPMAVTLPAVLILLDLFPLRRFRARQKSIWLEKLPFFAVSLGTGILMFLAEQKVNALATMDQLPIEFRVMNSFHSLALYLWRMFLPLHLAVLYPLHLKNTFSPGSLVSVPVVLTITFFCFWYRKRNLGPIIAWGYFLITLSPVLGIVQVGGQSSADRYTYIPSFGPFLLGSYFIIRIVRKKTLLLYGGILLLTVGLAWGARKQVQTWRSSVALWENTIDNDPRYNGAVLNCLGDAYREAGRYEDALKALSFPVKYDPSYYFAFDSLGKLYFDRGMNEESIQAFKISEKLAPAEIWAQCHLDVLYSRQGKKKEALQERASALSGKPNDPWEHLDIGKIYFQTGFYDQAVPHLLESLRSDPNTVETYEYLGRIYREKGEFIKAIESYEKGLTLEPGNRTLLEGLARSYFQAGKYRDASLHYLELSKL